MKKTVAIFINSEKKEFLLSLAKVLEDEFNFNTKLLLRDSGVKKFVDQLCPDRANDIILSDINIPIDNVFQESKIIEEKYNQKLSMLLSEDRALGQGYLFNVEKIPSIKRAYWSHDKKILELIQFVKSYEIALEGCDLVIRQWPDKVTSMITEEMGIECFTFVPIKFGSRMFWSNNAFITSNRYINRVQNYSKNIKNLNQIEYVIESRGDKVNKSVDYTFLGAFKQALRLVWNENKKWLRGLQKKDSYHYLGWLPSIFRRINHYKLLKSISFMPNEVLDYKICFFPLHLEPEVALLNFSPEFNNSMEAISIVSKSLPSDTLLVVKEQALSFGVRSKWYYKQVNKIPNVIWADPDVHSWDWIQSSKIVVTITGTVGIEAVYMRKPVISFGAHQIINYLPTVFYVDNYLNTNHAVNYINSDALNESDYEKSRAILQNAQIESSIDFPEIDSEMFKNKLNINLAKKALNNLFSEYPNIRHL